MTILQDVIQPNLGAWVDLFTLDLSILGGSQLHFTNNTDTGGTGAVSFGGTVYTPLPITAAGFEATADGTLPRPTLQVSNISGIIRPYLQTYKFFQGAKITRIRTLDKYLDGHSNADSTQFMNPQVWYIDQMSAFSNKSVQFVLVSPLDRPNVKIPGRQILRDNGFPGAGFPYIS